MAAKSQRYFDITLCDNFYFFKNIKHLSDDVSKPIAIFFFFQYVDASVTCLVLGPL